MESRPVLSAVPRYAGPGAGAGTASPARNRRRVSRGAIVRRRAADASAQDRNGSDAASRQCGCRGRPAARTALFLSVQPYRRRRHRRLFRAAAGSGARIAAARGSRRRTDGTGAPRPRPALRFGRSGRPGAGRGNGRAGRAGLSSAPLASGRRCIARRVRAGFDIGVARALQSSSVSPNAPAARLRRYRYSPSATDTRNSTMAKPTFSTGSRCVPLPTSANTRLWGR